MTTAELLLRAAEYIEAICDDLRDSGSETAEHATDRAFAPILRAAAERERWVPVDERLPPDNRIVLARSEWRPVNQMYFTAVASCRGGEWSHGCEGLYRVIEWRVAHWREIPEGPE